MFKIINELLHTSNKAIPDTQCPEDLANDFGRFIVGKVTTIRNEVDSHSINSSLSTTTCTQSSPVTCLFSEFRLMTNEELLSVIKKCPNKSCVLDPMPTWLVKQHIDPLLPTLCRILFNLVYFPMTFTGLLLPLSWRKWLLIIMSLNITVQCQIYNLHPRFLKNVLPHKLLSILRNINFLSLCNQQIVDNIVLRPRWLASIMTFCALWMIKKLFCCWC